MKTKDVLTAARAKIEAPAAWGKGRRHLDRPGHTCCAAEAIEDTVKYDTPNWLDLRTAAFDALCEGAGIDRRFGSVPEWNDAEDRKHGDVLAAFDKAIATV